MRKFTCLLALLMSIRGFADSIPGVTIQPLDFPASAGAMTVGRDGNLWFTDIRQNVIGRLTSSGQYTSFPIPSRNTVPVSITTGTDGNLWFVEGVGRVGRMTPTGVFTEFLIPQNLTGGAWAIASGPDGNAWFLEAVDGKHVARVDANGTFRDFAVPGAQYLGGIATAFDGLWLIDTGGNMIMKMRTDGSISATNSIPAGSSISSATGVTALDGTFWFIHGTGGIARITPNGVVTEYPIPTPNALPAGLALGNDGNIWFSDYSNNQIGQLVVSTATAGGHATINVSAPFGEKLADIFFLQPPARGASATTHGTTVLGSSSSCEDAEARVRKDNGSSGNVVAVKVLAPAHCADVAVVNNTYSPILRSTIQAKGTLTFHVWNYGKDSVDSGRLHISFYPNVPLSGPQLSCSGSYVDCNSTPSNMDCTGLILSPDSFCTGTVILTPVPGIDKIVIAGIAASSPLYDQDLNNNTSVLRIDTTTNEATAIPPDSNTPVVTNPIGR